MKNEARVLGCGGRGGCYSKISSQPSDEIKRLRLHGQIWPRRGRSFLAQAQVAAWDAGCAARAGRWATQAVRLRAWSAGLRGRFARPRAAAARGAMGRQKRATRVRAVGREFQLGKNEKFESV